MEQRIPSADSRIRKIPPEMRAAFWGSLVFGLVSQGMGMFNKYSWHDDIFSLFRVGDTVSSGRWMLYVLAELEILIFGDGHFSLPLMNGFFSLLCIGASAALTVRLLKIQNLVFCALLGAVMAAFPVITALFGFMFAVPYYMLALLWAVAGAYLIRWESPWWEKMIGAVLAGCSVGVYQAFLPVFLTLILFSDLVTMAEGKQALSSFWMNVLIQVILIGLSMGIYVAGSRYFLQLTGYVLINYMGLAEVDSVPLTTYIQRAGRAYREFFHPSRYASWDMYPHHVYYLHFLALGTSALLAIPLIIRMWKQSRVKSILFVLMLALIPLGCNFIFVMCGEVHGLMVYGQVFQVALFVWLADRLEISRPAVRNWTVRGAAAMLALTNLMYARYDNQCYLKTEFQQQEAISWFTTLVTRIKSTPGFRDELPVIWVNREKMQDDTLYNLDQLDFIRLSSYEENIRGYIANWAWDAYLAHWCGFSPQSIDEEEPEEEEGMGEKEWPPEIQAMPHYPDDGSIQIIDDAVVVNF